MIQTRWRSAGLVALLCAVTVAAWCLSGAVATAADPGNRYEAGDVGGLDRGLDGRAVDRVMQTDPKGQNGEVQFAMLESERGPNDPADPEQDEYLMTPALDLTNQTQVVLQYDSEVVVDGDRDVEVLAMQDTDGDGPDGGDTVLGTLMDYYSGAALNDEEDPLFAQRAFDVSALAAGKNGIFFAWHYSKDAGNDIGEFWAVDNVLVTGDVPEPSSILLLAIGLFGLCLWGRHR